jgi:hypothetical protein
MSIYSSKRITDDAELRVFIADAKRRAANAARPSCAVDYGNRATTIEYSAIVTTLMR